MTEYFDVVDEDDRPVGRATRREVHGDPTLIHRVAHVLVFDGAGRLFLQKRVDDKDVQPGKWDTSVGGHVDAGEDYRTAATREMTEELGISSAPLRLLYRYLHRNDYESEMVTTFMTRWDGEITVDPGEIAEGRFWTRAQIEAADTRVFTPNFLEELERYREWAAEHQPDARF